MTAAFLDLLFLGALTYLAHSTVFLGLAMITTGLSFFKNHALKELVLRLALFAGLITVPLHLSGAFQPLFSPITIPEETVKSEPAAGNLQIKPEQRVIEHEPEPTAQDHEIQPAIHPDLAVTLSTSQEIEIPVLEPRVENPGPAGDGLNLTYANLTLMIWLFFGAAFLVQLGALALALKTQLSGRKPLARGRAVGLAAEIAKKARIRPPALSTKADLAGPFCLARGEIVLPEWAGDLAPSQMKALIAHEIAHLKRKDPVWLLAGRIVQSLFFFQPLNFFAAHRLQELSEFSADAWARRVCGSGMPLAECLAECARRHLGRAPSVLGAAMATKRSPIVERTQMLLNNVADYSKTPSPAARGIVLGLFVMAAALFPVFGFEKMTTNALAADENEDGTAEADKENPTYVFINGEKLIVEPGKSYAIEKGTTITVSDGQEMIVSDEAPVMAVPGKSYLIERGEGYVLMTPEAPTPALEAERELSYSTRKAHLADSTRSSRSSHIMIDDDGEVDIRITYTSDDVVMKIRGEGRFRFNDEETAMEYMGDDSYLDITETRDGTKRRVRFEGREGAIYESYWLDGKETSKDAEMERWLAAMIPALYRQTGIDAAGRTKRIYENRGVGGVLDEIEEIPSSYTRRVYASTLVGLTDLSDSESERFMAVISDISGFYDLRETLTAYVKHQDLSEPEWRYFARAASHISSSYDLRETLSAAAKSFRGPEQNWRYLLDAAAGISSSYDLRETLVAFCGAMPKDDGIIGHLARVTGNISSSYDLRETLSAFAGEGGYGEGGWLALLDAAREISSSYDLRSTLEEFADNMPRNSALLERYREVARGISGGFDREQALDAIA